MLALVYGKNIWLRFIPVSLLLSVFGCSESSHDENTVVEQPSHSKNQLLQEAESILNTMRATSYQHSTQISVEQGIFNFDCSGFIDYIVEKTDTNAYAEIQSFVKSSSFKPESSRPLAQHFVLFFDALIGGVVSSQSWTSIETLSQAKPGDILAWTTPDGTDTNNTGHAMLVKELLLVNNAIHFLQKLILLILKSSYLFLCKIGWVNFPNRISIKIWI